MYLNSLYLHKLVTLSAPLRIQALTTYLMLVPQEGVCVCVCVCVCVHILVDLGGR